MNKDILSDTAQKMVDRGKGILAADESNSTCNKRFVKAGIPETEEMRRSYRELLFSTENSEKYLSGVILYDETIRQFTNSNVLFSKFLEDKGIMPGIKVDKGTVDLPGFEGEKITEGLDGLRDRFQEYKSFGAKFSKWRAVITIGENLPSRACLNVNATIMALYSLFAQEVDIVPMVEPEVLLDGSHGIEKAEEVTKETLKILFEELNKYNVYFPGVILKTSMIVPGNMSGEKMNANEVATRTSQVLKEVVPKDLGGVVFLSGGQSPEVATMNLNEISKLGPYPWGVTFSYSRALQQPALAYWQGKAENASHAQELFSKRLSFASNASIGEYKGE